MTTQIIGIKEFRKNITSIWKEAKQKKIRYIVMHHSMPIFEVNPLNSDKLILEGLSQDVKKARIQAKKGQVYTQQEVLEELGL